MSEYTAIAAVTATLRSMLQEVAQRAVPGAVVETGPPVSEAQGQKNPRIRIFLYSVTTNPHLRSLDQPVRNADGSFRASPSIALDLHYLLSFFGDERQLTAQLLLGAAVTFLEAQPVPLVRDMLNAQRTNAGEGIDIAASGLAEEAEQLSFVMEPLRHDELSRIWTIFFQVPYVLSVGYRCSVLVLRPTVDYGVAPPILVPHLQPGAEFPPELISIDPQFLPYAAGETFKVSGRRLDAAGLAVEIGEMPAHILEASESSAIVSLPRGLAAGEHDVRARRPAQSATGSRSLVSNPVPVVVLPRILGPVGFDGRNRHVTLRLDPPVQAGQQVALLLNRTAPSAGAGRDHRIPLATPSKRADEVDTTLPETVGPGHYLLRVSIDDAKSRLHVDGDINSPRFGLYDGPILTVATGEGGHA